MSITAVSFDLIRRIRCHINRTEKQAILLANHQKWLKLTSALDVLEDTAFAIEYYCDTEYPLNKKGKYLFTYGLIQALFVQGDAINSICTSLFNKSINFKNDYPEVYKIREMRDDVVGHPTNRRNGSYFIYLSQISMEKGSFHYIKENEKELSYDSIDVNVVAAINDVAKCVNDILNASVEDLDREFVEYIDKHKERKMKELFNNLGYAQEKVLLDTNMKNWGYEATKTMVELCEKELIERYGSIEAVESYQYLLKSIHNMYELFDNEMTRIPVDLRPQIEKCLLENLFSKLRELKSYCKETDSYFENYGEEPIEPSDNISVVIHDDNK